MRLVVVIIGRAPVLNATISQTVPSDSETFYRKWVDVSVILTWAH